MSAQRIFIFGLPAFVRKLICALGDWNKRETSTETSFLTQEAGFFSSFHTQFTTVLGGTMKEKTEAGENVQESERTSQDPTHNSDVKQHTNGVDDVGSDVGHSLHGW